MQEEALGVVLQCLAEEDARVRRVASETLVAMVTQLSARAARDQVAPEAFCLCHQRIATCSSPSHNVGSAEPDLEAISAKSLLKVYRGYDNDSPAEGISERFAKK